MKQSKSIFTKPLSLLVLLCAISAVCAQPASAQTAGNLKCNGCVDSKDIKNKSIRKSDIKNNAITGGKVKDSSLTGSDIGTGSVPASDLSNGPGADFDLNPTAGIQSFLLASTATIYRTVNLTVPSAGQVILNATGAFDGAGLSRVGLCSISKDGTLNGRTTTVGVVDTSISITPFAITWAESVAAAGTQTWNIVCVGPPGLYLMNPALTAIFVPTRY